MLHLTKYAAFQETTMMKSGYWALSLGQVLFWVLFLNLLIESTPLPKCCKEGTIFILILRMRNVRHKETEWLAQVYTGKKERPGKLTKADYPQSSHP